MILQEAEDPVNMFQTLYKQLGKTSAENSSQSAAVHFIRNDPLTMREWKPNSL